jgi:glucosamine kinase
MILVADSGSTKTDWRLIDEQSRKSVAVSSEGLNPYFLSEEEIVSILKAKVLPYVDHVDRIFFYGAGCGLPMKAQQVKNALDRVLPTTDGAMVTGDTLAAARSLLQNNPGICCILGTGSNGFVYDGTAIKATVPSLGYMFSDWGSGTVLGKDFLGLILQERVPAGIKRDFELTFRYNRMQILENIYNKPMANRFMASFTPFIYKYAEEESIKSIILDNFRRFFEYYVLPYDEFQTFGKVSMVGSIAYHFKKYLLQVADEMHIGVERVVKNPMEGLVEFHCRFTIEKEYPVL